MLINIRKKGITLRAFTNGGYQDSNFIGDLPGFFQVWYNPQYMVNILPLSDVRKRFRITIDTALEAAILIHLDDGSIIKFEEVGSGLYLFKSKKLKQSNKKISDYSYLIVVAGNKENFNNREISRADKARILYTTLGMPGYQKNSNF